MVFYLDINARSHSSTMVSISYRLLMFFNLFWGIEYLRIASNTQSVSLHFRYVSEYLPLFFRSALIRRRWYDLNVTFSSVLWQTGLHVSLSSGEVDSNTVSRSVSASLSLDSLIISVKGVSAIVWRNRNSFSEYLVSVNTFSLMIELRFVRTSSRLLVRLMSTSVSLVQLWRTGCQYIICEVPKHSLLIQNLDICFSVYWFPRILK